MVLHNIYRLINWFTWVLASPPGAPLHTWKTSRRKLFQLGHPSPCCNPVTKSTFQDLSANCVLERCMLKMDEQWQEHHHGDKIMIFKQPQSGGARSLCALRSGHRSRTVGWPPDRYSARPKQFGPAWLIAKSQRLVLTFSHPPLVITPGGRTSVPTRAPHWFSRKDYIDQSSSMDLMGFSEIIKAASCFLERAAGMSLSSWGTFRWWLAKQWRVHKQWMGTPWPPARTRAACYQRCLLFQAPAWDWFRHRSRRNKNSDEWTFGAASLYCCWILVPIVCVCNPALIWPRSSSRISSAASPHLGGSPEVDRAWSSQLALSNRAG